MKHTFADLCVPSARLTRNTDYTPLEDGESVKDNQEASLSRRHHRWAWLGPAALQLLLLLASLSLLAATGLHHLAVPVSSQTPWQNIGHLEEIRGPVMFKEPESMTPSLALDAAWDKLIDEHHFMLVPDEDAPKLDFRPRQPLRGSAGNRNGTLAVFEYVHALHCVHLLWKQTYPEYYKEDHRNMQNNPASQHAHIDHCADFLRQVILCNANFAVSTFYYNESRGGADVDIASSHTCINLDAANDYANRHYVNRSELTLQTEALAEAGPYEVARSL
ncbi:hypothetical protein LZ30DRAFT_820874 [Colletotrichum cereale]|nr:hypothetical protein LZ30DRAFT_820874 [Colletotrichum cereale]